MGTQRPADALASSQVRAKSDVANKLVAMLLGTMSQQQKWANQVRQESYIEAVAEAFKGACPYCGTPLALGTMQLEHLDAMNRYRAGLHAPGNVVPACKPCNLAKRQFDQRARLPGGLTGWETFLMHEPEPGCAKRCKVCRRWADAWPELSLEAKRERRQQQLERIRAFRRETMPREAEAVSQALSVELVGFYADGQRWAKEETERFIQRVLASSGVNAFAVAKQLPRRPMDSED